MYCLLMEWLNYHHLLYFWMVAREGTVAKAGGKLSLAQPTISGQLRALEEAVDRLCQEFLVRHMPAGAPLRSIGGRRISCL